MPLVINTNISSLNSQRQLMQSGGELDQAMERLSSGKRVNTAADDAAGLAIANRMTSQIRGLDQAIRNASDGVSMIQTAEGALDETTNIIQRIRELSIQAANGIYSDDDRSTLDAEVQQLKLELDRIAETTTFNGQPLLDGSLGDVELQVGSEANETVGLSITAMDTDSLGGGGGADVTGTNMGSAIGTSALLVSGDSAGTITINGQNVGDLSAQTTLDGILNTINENVSGVETTAFVEVVGSADGDGVFRGGNHLDLDVITADGETQNFDISGTGSMQELADQINAVTGGLVDASLNDEGRLVLRAENAGRLTVGYTGATVANAGIAATNYEPNLAFEITDPSIEHVNISVTGSDAGDADAIKTAFGIQTRKDGDITGNAIATPAIVNEGDVTLNGVALSGTTAGGTPAAHATNIAAMVNAKSDEHGIVATAATTGVVTLNSVEDEEIVIDLGATGTLASTGLIETNNAATGGDAISSISITTAAGAQKALDITDLALEEINAIRADLGAVNNRLEFTMSNLANVVENSSASRSRIMDADFAAESANLSRAQVLQQASQAMLAQANARPQQVLSLLQG